MSPRDFYNAVYSTAVGLGANDVQARLAAAQASEETGYGQSMLGNNAFGIKAGSSYTGPSFTAGTNEEYNGQLQREQANFRAYSGLEESVKDYLGTIQSKFPDAWNASTFSEAVKGLNTGVYGKYATLSAYGNHIKAIDNKYGGFSYAQNPENVPAPYGPNDPAPEYAVADDVLPVSDPNFNPVDPQFSYASNLASVPTPEARPEIQQGLLTAYDEPAPAARTPFDAVLGNVTAQGLLGQPQALEASATARPMMDLPASAELGTTPGLEAGTTAGLLSAATPSERMGIAEPSFDQSRFYSMAPSVASMDMSRFASDPKTSRIGQSLTMTDTARMNPLSGLIDPATNTQSFMDQPANLGSFPAGYTAQRGPTTGLLSADSQAVQGQAEIALNRALQQQQAMPATQSVTTSAIEQTPVDTQGLLSPAMTPAQIGAYQQMAASAPNITNLSGFTGIFDDGTGYQNAVPAQAQVPDLQQIEVADQPSIATVEGPATTPALEQQQQQQVQQAVNNTPSVTTQSQVASKPTLGQRITKAVNPGTLGGGLLGGLALGPVGGLVGGLLGNAAYQNGGISGLLGGPSWSAPSTQIAGGMANIAGLYGGAYSPGTFAVANNGATITAQPGGWSTYTNSYGVTEAIGPDGKIAGYFGSGATPDQETDTEGRTGGLFGGLFG